MTTQEAIDELKYSRDMCFFDPSTGETGKPYSEECERMAQALDIAIRALENESGEQLEQKTGRWIERTDTQNDVYYVCSNCKEEFTLIEGTPTDNLYNYCPNCGAYMKGE